MHAHYKETHHWTHIQTIYMKRYSLNKRNLKQHGNHIHFHLKLDDRLSFLYCRIHISCDDKVFLPYSSAFAIAWSIWPRKEGFFVYSVFVQRLLILHCIFQMLILCFRASFEIPTIFYKSPCYILPTDMRVGRK